jgi:hypothetical protein
MQEIEFHRRGLAMFYFVMAVIFTALGILFVVVALGEAVQKDSSKGGWMSMLQWSFGGMLWLLSAPRMWTMGRGYRKNYVRFTGKDVTFHTLSEQEYKIAFADIQSVYFEPSLRKRLLTIDTKEMKYSFDQRSCPSIGKVAELVKARAGSASR